MYDHRLIRKINQGRAFALVGSGPSSELGYASWRSLAEGVVEELKRRGRLTDPISYSKYLAQRKYPELFSQAERDLGDRAELVAILLNLLQVRSRKRGYIYETLTNWPFACYLTTNWDDEISSYLRSKKTYFSTIQNSKDDLSQIRNDTSRLIVKLHSDLTHPNQAVITSGDYARLLGLDGQYFRDRLRAIFEMFDVLIVGHSLSDPDLSLVLQVAKETASPEHPVFLIAADLTSAEIREYLERFNIVAASYENPDGSHLQLRRHLSLLDKFIIPRSKRLDLRNIDYSAEELEAAQAIAIYRRLVAAEDSGLSPASYLGPLILRSLGTESRALTVEQVLGIEPLASAAKTEGIRAHVPLVLASLKAESFVEQTEQMYKLTAKGLRQVKEIHASHGTEVEQAYGQFAVELQSRYPAFQKEKQSELDKLLQDTLVRVFKQRGLSIANAIFAGQSLGHGALSDVFSAISGAASELSPPDLAVAFIEASHEFLLNPTPHQSRYLASISQGYFLYHLFGLDPSCAKMRSGVFEHAVWWCDSSTIIPLLAAGSSNHEYAVDLFARLQKLSAYTLTTGKLVREVVEHLAWAIRFLDKESLQSPAVLEAATEKAGYKQNLFLDGYIRLSAEGKTSKFHEYVDGIVPQGATDHGVRKALSRLGVRIINADELEGFKPEHTDEIFELLFEITEERQKWATLRSNLQVEAEAEILHVIRKLKEGIYKLADGPMELEHAYFLSQSRILDRIPPADPISWTPEVLYRYLLSLPGEKLNPDLLQRCMIQEYFGTGLTLIDKTRYEKFFGPSIDVANTTFKEEKSKYLKDFASVSSKELDAAYQETPDLEKPFFIQQLGWRVAQKERNRAQEATKMAVRAEHELAQMRLERDSKWKRRQTVREKQLEAEERNARDPKHLRKKHRQAKRRKHK